MPVEGSLAPRPLSRGDALPRLCRGAAPPATPRMEVCIFFQGVQSSWGINTAENKDL